MIYSNLERPVAGTLTKLVTLLKAPSESPKCCVWFRSRGEFCRMKISPSNAVKNRGR